MRYIFSLLLIIMLVCCSTPTVPNSTTIELLDSSWVIFSIEEWSEHKEWYIKTFGELEITATIHNTGGVAARNIRLLVELYEDKEKTMILCSGDCWITQHLEAGMQHSFTVKYKFEYCKQVSIRGVNLGVSWE